MKNRRGKNDQLFSWRLWLARLNRHFIRHNRITNGLRVCVESPRPGGIKCARFINKKTKHHTLVGHWCAFVIRSQTAQFYPWKIEYYRMWSPVAPANETPGHEENINAHLSRTKTGDQIWKVYCDASLSEARRRKKCKFLTYLFIADKMRSKKSSLLLTADHSKFTDFIGKIEEEKELFLLFSWSWHPAINQYRWRTGMCTVRICKMTVWEMVNVSVARQSRRNGRNSCEKKIVAKMVLSRKSKDKRHAVRSPLSFWSFCSETLFLLFGYLQRSHKTITTIKRC